MSFTLLLIGIRTTISGTMSRIYLCSVLINRSCLGTIHSILDNVGLISFTLWITRSTLIKFIISRRVQIIIWLAIYIVCILIWNIIWVSTIAGTSWIYLTNFICIICVMSWKLEIFRIIIWLVNVSIIVFNVAYLIVDSIIICDYRFTLIIVEVIFLVNGLSSITWITIMLFSAILNIVEGSSIGIVTCNWSVLVDKEEITIVMIFIILLILWFTVSIWVLIQINISWKWWLVIRLVSVIDVISLISCFI